MYRYGVIQMRAAFSPGGLYGIFGVQERGGNWVPVAAAAPLPGGLEAVAALSEKCTALQLAPEHLLDVASDYISRTAGET